jgi:3-isopropylmalate dehydrogenase
VEDSALRPDIARGMDMLIVRESNGDVYFGDKGRRMTSTGRRQAYDLMSYDEDEIMRVARVGFEAARARRKKLCSVGKANVLETSELWRDVVSEVSAGFPDVELRHMYADNAAMQLMRNPGQFDVIVTGNLFGDILSDEASMCAGSIGMQPSATLGAGSKGLYEPIHGSAPDIAGAGIANPLGAILSASMMLRYSLSRPLDAVRIEDAVAKAIKSDARTRDIGGTMSTSQMGDAVLAAIT